MSWLHSIWNFLKTLFTSKEIKMNTNLSKHNTNEQSLKNDMLKMQNGNHNYIGRICQDNHQEHNINQTKLYRNNNDHSN